ncbi:MAG: hypothetical protein ACTSYA_05255 [Candidatus Kariarchaeaceae archaeon]
MTYVIKTYQEEFLEDHEIIGTVATKDWKFYGQTPAARLKESYSREDFDPETRLYCFKDDKMVGFQTARIVPSEEGETKIRGSLEFPVVMPGNEEAYDLLMDQMLKTLKEKGVEVIHTRVSDGWLGTNELSKKWGLNYKQDAYISFKIELSEFAVTETKEMEVVAYDHERDLEKMVKIFTEVFSLSEEQARANFELINTNTDDVLAHLLVNEGEEIVGRLLALNMGEENDMTLGNIYATNDDIRMSLLTKAIAIGKEKGKETLFSTAFGDLEAKVKELKGLGFEEDCVVTLHERDL